MATTPVTFSATNVQDREVMMFTYSFNQAVDKEGQMAGIPRGGKIVVRVKALNDGKPDIVKWMIDQKMHKNGRLLILNTTDGTKLREIEFVDAYCVDYKEYWEDMTNNVAISHYEEFVLSCREITINSVKYTNDWK